MNAKAMAVFLGRSGDTGDWLYRAHIQQQVTDEVI
jgi:hypothetical protein